MEGNLLLGGDFNARIENEGGIIEENEKNRYAKQYKDRIINREGRVLLQEISE